MVNYHNNLVKFACFINFSALIHIGNIQLGDKALFLAPMEDVTDPSFRFICKHFGADMVYTEFIPSDGLIRDAKKSLKKLELSESERPIGIQLYGHLIESMVEAAKIAEEANPDLIDINFGCPVKKIANRGAGAGMLCNIPLMVEMTKAIVEAVKLPVTVKTRLGWDDSSKHIVEIAEKLQDVGIKALTIHGRTRAQFYKGNADWSLIGEVKNNPRMKIPIIGNGDIVTPQSALDAFNRYGVDGIMIGRATVGRPWIFREIRHFLNTGELLPAMTLNEKVDLARLQFRKSLEVKGIPRGIFEMRRHFINYFKGLPDFRDIRMKLVTTLDIEEIEKLLDLILISYPKH
jgi:nifR3 family TIM-barrel protein